MAKSTHEADDDRRVHELVDIIAEEVSDVDRAANRRTYLVVKRSEDMDDDDTLGPELVEDDDGNLTMFEKAEDDDEGDDDDDDEDAPAPRRARASGTAAKKQAIELPAGVKPALLRALAEVLERLTAVVAAIKDAKETDERMERPMPDSVARELKGMQDQLAKLLDRYPARVSKAGAKLANKRRAQLQSVIELLQKLLEEVSPADAGAPSSIAASPVAKSDAGAVAELGGLFASLADGVRALTAKVKTQDAEIARLKKSTGLPASREVESTRAPKPPDPVSWPMDMNAPLTREQVAKDISFFDD